MARWLPGRLGTVPGTAVSGAVIALGLAVGAVAGCVGPPAEPRAGGDVGPDLDLGLREAGPWSPVSDRPGGSGRFRLRTEAGVDGHGVVESVVVGAFDESDGSFEATLDLDRLAEGVQGSGLLTGRWALGGELVIRSAAGLVFARVDERGWILLPGSPEEVLAEAGIVRPDALLDLLDEVAEAVVAVDGVAIDGEPTTRYSGWLGAAALEAVPGGGGSVAGVLGPTGLDPLVGLGGVVVPAELADRMVRFDVWVDGRGRARRLVVEADLAALAEVSRRVDGHDDGIDRLRLRHEVEWFDLDVGVTIEPPPRWEVSVIDSSAWPG